MRTKRIGNLDWQEDVPDRRFTWDEAKAYAASLGDGWRLPTVQELVGLWDYEIGKSPAFPDSSGWFWSSSPYGNGRAWVVNFDYGSVNGINRSSEYAVRCLRWAGDVSADRKIDSSASRYAAELRALADRIEWGEA